MRQDVKEATEFLTPPPTPHPPTHNPQLTTHNPISEEIKKVRFIRGCLARGAALLKRKKKHIKTKRNVCG
jgi:hypothetical protein